MKKLINRQPSRAASWALGLLPFALLIVVYMLASDARLADNPNDKLLPALDSFVQAINRMAFEPSKRSGEYLLLADTLASLQRIGSQQLATRFDPADTFIQGFVGVCQAGKVGIAEAQLIYSALVDVKADHIGCAAQPV